MLFTSILLAFAAPALAAVTPTSPDGSTVVKVGGTIDAQWSADTAGTWTNTTIQLMSGANLNMTALATVAYGINGQTTTSVSIPVPDVSPYSKIYFLQFTNGGDTSTATWTTRFTIAGSDGSTTEPTESTTTSGTTVQWGYGNLVGTVAVVDGADASSSSSSSSSSASASTSSTAATTAAAAAVSSASSGSSDSSDSSTASSAAGSSSASKTASSSAASASSSSGASHKATIGLGAVVLALTGVAAF